MDEFLEKLSALSVQYWPVTLILVLLVLWLLFDDNTTDDMGF